VDTTIWPTPQGAKRIKDDTVLIVDISDLIKKYARKMEYLARVRDSSEKKKGNGYRLCEVVGAEVGSSEITPLAQTLWSQVTEDFVSKNAEILEVVSKVLKATEKRGILALDRGGDRRRFYQHWVPDESVDFIIRQRVDRNLLHKGKAKKSLQLANTGSTPYAATVIKEK